MTNVTTAGGVSNRELTGHGRVTGARQVRKPFATAATGR